MAMTWAERFVRSYARVCVDAIQVESDILTATVTLTFYNRSVRVSMNDLVLQDDAFRRLGEAISELLGIPKDWPTVEVPRET